MSNHKISSPAAVGRKAVDIYAGVFEGRFNPASYSGTCDRIV